MKKYIKKYIRFIVTLVLTVRFPFFFYRFLLRIRTFIPKRIRYYSELKYSSSISFELIITQLDGGGVQSVINHLIQSNIKQKYVVIFFKNSTECIVQEYYHNKVLEVSKSARSSLVLIKLINEKLCQKITIHHLRKSNIKEMINILYNRKDISIPIETHLHDFFFICPTIFLMDDKSKFCNLDKMHECNRCSVIQAAVSPFSNIGIEIYDFQNIKSWRECSQKLFDITSKIVVYSKTTMNMYKRVFAISDSKIEVSNALFSLSTNFKKLPKDYDLQKFDKINIAMIGSWHYIKGLNVFKEMQNIINKNQHIYSNISLYFIGKGFCEIRSKIKNLGSYNSDTLASIIEKNKISMCFIPSVCCETFSITTQDCIEVGVPVATFALGAMKERIFGIKNALVIEEITNSNISKFSDQEIANIAITNILTFIENKSNKPLDF